MNKIVLLTIFCALLVFAVTINTVQAQYNRGGYGRGNKSSNY